MDSDFAEDLSEVLSEARSEGRSSDRQSQRKARQLCRQVQRALNLAFANYNPNDPISGLFAEEVFPAPDCGNLLVYVLIPAGVSVAEAIAALRRDTPRLRSEVAGAITRKRAPQLSFVPACDEGGRDE